MLLQYEILGQQVASLRKKKQLSQSQLASRIGMCPKFLSNIETGHHARVGIYTLARLATGLGITIDELVGRG